MIMALVMVCNNKFSIAIHALMFIIHRLVPTSVSFIISKCTSLGVFVNSRELGFMCFGLLVNYHDLVKNAIFMVLKKCFTHIFYERKERKLSK
jgi:hypothetical protein